MIGIFFRTEPKGKNTFCWEKKGKFTCLAFGNMKLTWRIGMHIASNDILDLNIIRCYRIMNQNPWKFGTDVISPLPQRFHCNNQARYIHVVMLMFHLCDAYNAYKNQLPNEREKNDAQSE